MQFDASLRELADELEIAGREDAYADVLRLVGEWLSGSSRRWLLVLDDVDPEDGLSEPTEDVINAGSAKSIGNNVRGMVDSLATCPHGQIIMTTRHQDVALHFTDDTRDVISIGPMEEADARALFQSRAGEQHEKKDIERLVVELGCIPQAITYAAAFIGNTEPQYSVRTYLELLSKASLESDETRVLANEDSSDQCRDYPKTKDTILWTWKVSFEHLVQTRPLAADRMFLMAFLNCRRVPRSLIHTEKPTNIIRSESQITTADCVTDPGVDEDISTLLNLRFIGIVPQSTHVSTTRHSQLATFQWLKLHDDHDRWQSRYIKNLVLALPPPGPFEQKMSRWRKLFPHAQWALTVAYPQDAEIRVSLAKLCHEAGWYLCQSTAFRASAALLERCWAERKELLGDEHLDTLLSLIMLGGVQELIGNQDEARQIFERCLRSAERHPDSNDEGRLMLALCLEKMGSTELDHGHLEEAEIHLRRALECYDNLSGYDQSYGCVSALKEVLLKQGKYAAAESTCRHALARCTETYGNEHSHTIIMSRNLVEVLRRQGDLNEGMEIAERILAISQRVFGVDDRQSLETMLQIALLLRTQRKCQEATDLLERVHRMSSDRYGKESVVTLGYADSYARALKHIGKFDQALDVMRACATSTQGTLGAGHKDTIGRCQLLAKLELKRQRHDVRFVHEIRLERHARRKEKLKCIVQ